MPDPALCTEEVNPNYTIGTFDLFIQGEGGTEFNVGNIQTGGFQFTPTIVEHRLGKTNSLDAVFRVGSDYIINFTADEITIPNLATMLNESWTTVAGGCQIPFTGSRCVPSYYVRLEHGFPCATKSLNIVFWRAQILGDFTMPFDPATFMNLPGIIKSLSCESIHPSNPFGYAFISEACPAS